MRRRLIRNLMPALLLFACGPDVPITPSAADQDVPARQHQALMDLARWSGARWQIRYDATYHTAAFLEGHTPSLSSPDKLENATQKFVLAYRALFGLTHDSELSHVSTTLDEMGMRHIRFDQRLGKVPIWGTSLTVHLDSQGGVQHVHGKTVPLGDAMETQPQVAQEAARQQALDQVRADVPGASLSAAKPVLYYLPLPEGLKLVWLVEVEGQDSDLPIRLDLFLDAGDGTVQKQTDRVAWLGTSQPAQGSGIGVLGDRRQLDITQRGTSFYLEDQGRGKQRTTDMSKQGKLPGTTLSSKDPDHWDEAASVPGVAVDVHAHLSTLWDYFATTHGRFGWNGKGAGLPAAVHLGGTSAGLFDGRHLLFRDGDGGDLLPAGTALDVVAHEYTHAVIRSSADLDGHEESGALDEGLADLFACLAEQSALPGQGNWTIGEALARPGTQAIALRDLADPQKTDQASTLAEYQSEGDEKGDSLRQKRLHNAGIIGHAGYLLAQRIGNAQAGALFYRAILHYLQPVAGFFDAADATMAAARDLHGDQTPVLADLQEIWSQVGVGNIETIGETSEPSQSDMQGANPGQG